MRSFFTTELLLATAKFEERRRVIARSIEPGEDDAAIPVSIKAKSAVSRRGAEFAEKGCNPGKARLL